MSSRCRTHFLLFINTNKCYNRPFYIDFPLLSVVIYTQISNDYKSWNAFCVCRFPAIRQDIQAAKTTETLSSQSREMCQKTIARGKVTKVPLEKMSVFQNKGESSCGRNILNIAGEMSRKMRANRLDGRNICTALLYIITQVILSPTSKIFYFGHSIAVLWLIQ